MADSAQIDKARYHILKALLKSGHKPAELRELLMEKHMGLLKEWATTVKTSPDILAYRAVASLTRIGFASKRDNRLYITQAGREAIETETQTIEVVRRRIEIPKDPYDGAELKHLSNRPDAYDYKRVPSLMGGTRVAYRV